MKTYQIWLAEYKQKMECDWYEYWDKWNNQYFADPFLAKTCELPYMKFCCSIKEGTTKCERIKNG